MKHAYHDGRVVRLLRQRGQLRFLRQLGQLWWARGGEHVMRVGVGVGVRVGVGKA